jgi:PAS domain S-box-containing protein
MRPTIEPVALSAILDELPTVVWALDAADRFVYFNDAAREFFHGVPEAALGLDWHDLVHPDDHAPIAEIAARHEGSSGQYSIELRTLAPDRSWRWVQVSFRRTSDELSEETILVAVSRDLSAAHPISIWGGWRPDALASRRAGRATRAGLEAELREAIANDELSLYLQPKLEMDSLKLVGFEALVRWHHPERGLLSPDGFIVMAEEALLLRPLTRWVFTEVASHTIAWHSAGLQPVPVSINVSAEDFLDGLLQEHLPAYRRYNPPAGFLEIEITEHALFEDIDRASEITSALKQDGIKVAMDDFGTGYSTLARLTRLPVSTLKIDPVLTRDLDQNSGSRAIASGIIGIARELGLGVVAEGVETDAQLEVLRRLDCDIVQGHLLGPPMPAADAAALLERVTPR